MSFKGEVELQCPQECEPFTTQVWSFIRGDQTPDLRLALVCREANMVICPSCSKPFFADVPFVYLDPTQELLAFVFPEGHKAEEGKWREKMHADFLRLKEGLGGGVPIEYEPEIFFGEAGLSELLGSDDYRGEEAEVMAFIAKDLGLSLFAVSPHFSRVKGVPPLLPSEGRGEPTVASVVAGLKKIVKANDRLTAYSSYLKALSADPKAGLPPASKAPKPKTPEAR